MVTNHVSVSQGLDVDVDVDGDTTRLFWGADTTNMVPYTR